MSAMSDYLEPRLLDELFNKVDFVGPSVFVALFTAAPSDAGGGTEVSGGAYARQLVDTNASAGDPKWNLAVVDGIGFLIDNLNDIVFPVATATWGLIVAFGIFDAVTGGNLLVHGTLTVDKQVNTDDTFKFLIGELDIIFE